ncbi:MAG: TonB-dependent receptor, partial [Cyanobacteria bacterium RUI128]|nr:TonB-dependent receptor [Cyanobacteria bacterium RUI128]
MKKKMMAMLLSAAFFCGLSSQAIQETTDMRDDGQEAENRHVLYGQLTDKQVYSLNNYAADAASSGASVDIITREDIKGQNTPDISKLLNQTTSVTYGQGSGGYGQPSSLIIRGSDRVLFTLDGVRIDNPLGTARTTDLRNWLLTDDIERIEVVRGPQGTIAGHTSSGGMIAARTRRGSGRLNLEAESLFGSYGYFKERFGIMGGGEKFDHYTAVTWFKTDDGTWYENDARRGDNAYNNLNIVGNYGVRLLNGKAELRDIIRYTRGRKNLGMFDGYYSWGAGWMPGADAIWNDNNYSVTNDLTNVLSWSHEVNDRYNYDIRASVYNSKYDMNYINGPSPYDNDNYKYSSRATRFNIGTQHNVKIVDWDTLSIGYNFETENYLLESNGLAFDWTTFGVAPIKQYERGTTIQHDVYAQDCINIKDILFIRGGARLSTNSKYGTWVSPNASAALVLPTFKINGAKTTFRGSWGMNKNTPTLYQRFGDGGKYVLPNPDLDPERANSWDVGVTQSFFNEKLSLDFGYFNSNYKDYIAADYNFLTGKTTYKNLDEAKIQGYEGKLTIRPNEKISLMVNYTYTDAKNPQNGSRLPLVSENRVNGTIIWSPVERFNLYVGVEGGSDRYYGGGKTLPGYVDMNIGTKIRLFTVKNTHVYLQGDVYNLLNQKIACGYYGNGRIYRPGINFRLG